MTSLACSKFFSRRSFVCLQGLYRSFSKDGTISVSQSDSKKIQDLLEEAKSKPDSSENDHEYPSDVKDAQQFKTYDKWKESVEHQDISARKTNPRETSIILFPGQGSQFVGMGQHLIHYPNVMEMFDVANEILGYDLLKVCLNGPKQELDKTIHCQPALFVTSLAAVEKLKDDHPEAIENCVGTAGFSVGEYAALAIENSVGTAGFSVGEYAALVFAGVLSFEDALEIIKVRASAMQEASLETPSGLMSVFVGADSKLKFAMKTAREYIKEFHDVQDPVCSIANYLYSNCKVIGGHQQALDWLKKDSVRKDFSLRRLKPLPVSGAFHTNLMRPAKEPLQKAIQKVHFEEPLVNVYSNVTGKRYPKPAVIKKSLVDQIVKPVLWEQTLHYMYARDVKQEFPDTYEVGPGKQLGTVLKVVNGKAHTRYHAISV
ncbi:unnamed protein product [Owenia fusiformis]|uniref:[acyl-carrier-protein] S-malonyltransferase n=1 Tax=Owenia fusiformis TaxID=6347 RepID=A0A8S4NE33_OWEFU|nr:unnamed protein product [Owenia fusiformis]